MNIHKKLLYILLGVTTGCALVHAWSGRVVPMAYDQSKQEWNVLLGYTNNDGWIDFWANPTKQEKNAAQTGARALKAQTKGAYDVSLQGTPYFKDGHGGYIHFVQVPFISGKQLYQNHTNQYRKDFAWIPLNEFLTQGSVARPHNKTQVSVTAKTHAAIKQFGSQAVQQFTMLPQQQAVAKIGLVRNPKQAQAVAAGQRCQVAGCPQVDDDGTNLYFYDNKIHPSNEYLGNYYLTSITLSLAGQQVAFRCAEAAFQAGKFLTLDNQGNVTGFNKNVIQQLQRADGHTAWSIGQNKQLMSTKGWSQGFNEVWMKQVVEQKFAQNPKIAAQLRATGNRTLVEHSHRDDFWGVGKKGTGKNMLGVILMQTRSSLVKQSAMPQQLAVTQQAATVKAYTQKAAAPQVPTTGTTSWWQSFRNWFYF